MPLFRFHRRLLEESLKTTIIVKNQHDLKKSIKDSWWPWSENDNIENFSDFCLKIYIPGDRSLLESFDPRCGWYTHYVCVNIMKKERFDVCGFLSEPF